MHDPAPPPYWQALKGFLLLLNNAGKNGNDIHGTYPFSIPGRHRVGHILGYETQMIISRFGFIIETDGIQDLKNFPRFVPGKAFKKANFSTICLLPDHSTKPNANLVRKTAAAPNDCPAGDFPKQALQARSEGLLPFPDR